MSAHTGEAWSEILDHLSQSRKIPPQLVETWLRPLHPREGTEPVLCLEAPNKFHLQYVKEKFGATLNETVHELMGSAQQWNLAVGSGNESGPAPEAQASHIAAPVPFHAPTTRYADQPAARPAPPPSFLNSKYTFENFVVGKSNQFCHAAAVAVAEHPGTTYNPLFIFGGSGLGKTHIMQAIGNHIRRMHGTHKQVHYASAENFMNEMIGSIQAGQTAQFRNKYRRMDVLLIDDVHFLRGKESTQEEFFHTFNALHEAHRQIVLTSDRPPKEIPALEERLVSRFSWGLVTDIQPPDFETRMAILRKKAEDDGMPIPSEVLELIASNVHSNIRELEGSLVKLLAFSSLVGGSIDLALAREVLKNFLKAPDRIVTVEQIQKVVADHFGIPEEAMRVRKRTNSIAYPRQIAMFLAREYTGLSLSELGNRFGGRDHTTVMHAIEKISAARQNDLELRQILERLAHALKISQ
jgi:chromosomal replication initiator protein